MPDRMPNRMPEDMSDRMPEDLPVRKCINVMVGIIRSEVIVLFFKQKKDKEREGIRSDKRKGQPMFPARHKHLAGKTTVRMPTETTANIDQWETKKKKRTKPVECRMISSLPNGIGRLSEGSTDN